MAEAISPQLLKILVDVTSEVTLDGALRIVTQGAIDHRLERLIQQIRTPNQSAKHSYTLRCNRPDLSF